MKKRDYFTGVYLIMITIIWTSDFHRMHYDGLDSYLTGSPSAVLMIFSILGLVICLFPTIIEIFKRIRKAVSS